MSQQSLHAAITDLVAPLAASMQLELWGLEVSFGPRSLVRVFVEGPDGVDIEACAELSRLLGLSLEVEDVIAGPYVLEVSSPGLERTFFTADQLAAAVGNPVQIALERPLPDFPDRKKFRGVLISHEDGTFALAAEDLARPGDPAPLVRFRFEDLKTARQLHIVPDKTPPGKGRKQPEKKAPSRAGPVKAPRAPELAELDEILGTDNS